MVEDQELPTIPTEQSPFHTLSIGIAQNGSGSIPPELQNDYWPMFRYGGCTSIPLESVHTNGGVKSCRDSSPHLPTMELTYESNLFFLINCQLMEL